MTSAFLYLVVCSAKNRVLRRLRRLREPRYLAGAVVGIAYLYLMFIRRIHAGRPQAHETFGGLPAEAIAGVELAGAFVLWLIVACRWIVPVSTQPLKLSGAERDLLQPAPVTRRRITRYKLLRSQAAVFLSTLLMLIVAWTAVRSAWSFVLGTFLLFSTLRIHLLGVALTRDAARQHGGRRDVASVVALAFVLLSTVGVLTALAPAIAYLARSGSLGATLPIIREAAARPVARLALLPYGLLVKTIFASWPAPFLAAAWPVVALLVLNFAWVIRAQESVEESAVSGEQELAEGRRAPLRPVYRPVPFTLASTGRPEWALVWKNLIMLGRYASVRMLLRVALPLVIVCFVAATSGRSEFSTAALPFTIALACGLTFLGPYSFRNDLRQDAPRLPVLKTWPISGERLLWGELLAPWVVVSCAVWTAILATGVFALGLPPAPAAWPYRVAIGISAAIAFPAVILGQLVVQNASVVLFPGWVVTGSSRPRGVEAMGQQMLMFGGTLLVLALGILPGALIGGVFVLLAYPLFGWLAVIPAAILAAGLLVGEAVLAIHLLGGVIDRTDPSMVDTGQ